MTSSQRATSRHGDGRADTLERNEHKRWQMPPAPECRLVPLGRVGDVHSLQTMIGEAWNDVGELKKWIFHGLLCPAPSRTLPAIGSLTLTTEMHFSQFSSLCVDLGLKGTVLLAPEGINFFWPVGPRPLMRSSTFSRRTNGSPISP